MKRFFTILFLFISLTTPAQTVPVIINSSLTDSSLRLLYIGIDNRIEVKGAKNPAEISLVITGGGFSIKNIDPTNYVIRANSLGICILSIYQRNKILTKIEYKSDTLGQLFVGLNSHRNETMRRSLILSAPWLNLYFNHSHFNSKGQVFSFTMKTELNGDSVFIIANGNRLNLQQLNTIKQILSGTVIGFEDIRVGGVDCRVVKIEPFWIKIE